MGIFSRSSAKNASNAPVTSLSLLTTPNSSSTPSSHDRFLPSSCDLDRLRTRDSVDLSGRLVAFPSARDSVDEARRSDTLARDSVGVGELPIATCSSTPTELLLVASLFLFQSFKLKFIASRG